VIGAENSVALVRAKQERVAVKLPLASIGTLMIVVGIFALNLGAGRLVATYDRARLWAIIASTIVLQFAIFRSVQRNGLARIFWTGFVVANAFAIISLFVPGSRSGMAWYQYLLFAGGLVKGLPELSRLVQLNHGVFQLVFALIVLLPVLLISFSGGLLVLFIARVADNADSAGRP
jgi:hypothetical protein